MCLDIEFPERKKINKVVRKICLDDSDKDGYEHKELIKEIIAESKIEKNNQFYLFSKVMCCIIYMADNPHSILLLEKTDSNFDNGDFSLIKAIVNQIEAGLNILALKKKSDEIMQNISHQVISPLKGLETHCNNLIQDISVKDHNNYFSYNNTERKIFVSKLLKSQTINVRNILSNYQSF